MNTYKTCLFCTFIVAIGSCGVSHAQEPDKQTSPIKQELNDYWAEVSRCVGEGDFVGYSATCHPQGILVSGTKQSSYPLTQALKRWKPGFDDTQAKRMTASVEFRFSQRFHDPTTAHETGIFQYASTRDGKESIEYIRFEGLLRKSPAGWQIMMEYQKSTTTEAEWKALAPKNDPKKS